MREDGNENIPVKLYIANICGEDQRVVTYKGKRHQLCLFKKKWGKNKRMPKKGAYAP